MAELGRTLLIVNPVAQSGRGARAGSVAYGLLQEALGPADVAMRPTEYEGHARDIAAGAADFDTVIALGGDGIIHETVNGLMTIDCDRRPAFGVIPVGSGNDYAKTLAMDHDVPRAIAQLLAARPLRLDVGNCNGEWFAETVSFGLDAAIALDTMERRKKKGRSGTMLYMAAGFDQLINHLDSRSFTLTLDGGRPLSGSMYLLAVQNGPSYGGGFKVCPNASVADGMLDVAVADKPLGRARAALIFLMAKEGHHTRFKDVSFYRARRVQVSFGEPLPAQIDGERLEGTDFNIFVEQRALTVLVPRQADTRTVGLEQCGGYVEVEEPPRGR